MQEFVITLVQTVIIELIGVFGIFFLLGYALSLLQEATHAHYRETIGWKGILCTAWIGTPIHEIGHLFFAKLFRHRIHTVSFFGPNERTGGLGYIDHSYKKTSLYQSIGNFFIGSAPLLWGSAVLVLLLIVLVPNGQDVLASMSSIGTNVTASITGLSTLLLTLFSAQNIQSPQFWVFLYVSLCIVSHIAPSKQDRIGMWKGLAWIVLLLGIVNIIPLLLGYDPTQLVGQASAYLRFLSVLFLYALLLSLFHYIVSFALYLTPFRTST